VGVLFSAAVFFLAAAFFVAAAFFAAADDFEADVLEPDDFEPELLEPEAFEPELLEAREAFFEPADLVAGVVAVAVCVDALCAALPDESSLPQPANARASTIPVVAVSLRGTAPTIPSGALTV